VIRAALASLVAASVVGLAAGCGGSAASTAPAGAAGHRFSGAALSPTRQAPDFALRDQKGALVRLSDERGRLVLVTFLYTHCVDVCPFIAETLNTALRQLGAEAGDVRVFAVSVDPKGDTPSAVRRFVRSHGLLPQFHYLTGSRPALANVWHAYHVGASKSGPGVLDHSAYTLLVDRGGDARLLYAADAGPAAVLADLRQLLG
jgi:protein SCO1/2